MAVEDIYNETLRYLKKKVSINTFRLARELDLDRHRLLNIIKKLEEKGAVEVKHGLVKFLKFPEEAAKIVEKSVEMAVSKPKKKIKRKAKPKVLQFLQTENKQLKEKLLELEGTIKELEQKASAPIKVIKKTIVKEVPVTKKVIRKVPIPFLRKKKKVKKIKKKKKAKKTKKASKKKRKSKKFKFPKFKLMKRIGKLKTSKFIKKRGK